MWNVLNEGAVLTPGYDRIFWQKRRFYLNCICSSVGSVSVSVSVPPYCLNTFQQPFPGQEWTRAEAGQLRGVCAYLGHWTGGSTLLGV